MVDGPSARRVNLRATLAALVLLAPHPATAQTPLHFSRGSERVDALILAVDEDDDDDDGRSDAEQPDPPPDDAPRVRLRGEGPAEIDARGVRVLWAGRPLALPASIRLPAEVRLQAVGTDAHVVLRQGRREARLEVTAIRMRFEDADGRPLDATTDALAPSMQIPSDDTLPPDPETENARDARAFRLRLEGVPDGVPTRAILQAMDGDGRRSRLPVRLHREGATLRSPWLRLALDELDERASGRTLRAELRDRVEMEFMGGAAQSLRVGRPAHESGPLATRSVPIRVHVLRVDGRPVVGGNDAGALAIARQQVEIANEVWGQCLLYFELAELRIEDPPTSAVLSIADGDGLPAAGGLIRFRADGQPVTVRTEPGESPLEVAERVRRALSERGFDAQVHRIPRTEYGAGPAADVVVRSPAGRATLSQDGDHPLGTDARQRVRIGAVDLGDGLQEFDNRNSMGGTLEERALVIPTRGDEGGMLELYIVNGFTGGTRQGEAFIPGDRGPLHHTVIIDRRGVALGRSAWTAAHEIGHVLLDQPFHPDDLGPDRPWLLMDSNGNEPTVLGPKRLTPAECARARDRR